MALASLATVADLSDRGVDVSSTALVQAKLDAASEAVREAAGSPISETTSTITLESWGDDRLVPLPGGPVTAVTSVTVDGEAVTDWTLWGSVLRFPAGWHSSCSDPAVLVVTYTHGYAEVPADIVDLVCQFAIAGINEATQGSRAGLAYESIDDYRVGYQQGADATASALEVPERTARMLRARFGGGTYVTSEAR